MTEFPLRQIGHTGLQVTELGVGCATLGGSQIAVARAAAEETMGATLTMLDGLSMPSRLA